MATTTISVSSFQTACAECADAIIAGDFATARSKYAVAETINAGLELEASDADVRYRRRDTLAGVKKAIDEAELAATSNTDTTRRLVTARTNFQS